MLLRTPPQVLVGLLEGNQLIGYGGLVHIAWEHKRAEMSFLADTGRSITHHYREDLAAFVSLVVQLARENLDIHRIYTETYAYRDAHLAALELTGFVREGRLRDHNVLDGHRVDSILHGMIVRPDRERSLLGE